MEGCRKIEILSFILKRFFNILSHLLYWDLKRFFARRKLSETIPFGLARATWQRNNTFLTNSPSAFIATNSLTLTHYDNNITLFELPSLITVSVHHVSSKFNFVFAAKPFQLELRVWSKIPDHIKFRSLCTDRNNLLSQSDVVKQGRTAQSFRYCRSHYVNFY